MLSFTESLKLVETVFGFARMECSDFFVKTMVIVRVIEGVDFLEIF